MVYYIDADELEMARAIKGCNWVLVLKKHLYPADRKLTIVSSQVT
jgi:hypothetical protein